MPIARSGQYALRAMLHLATTDSATVSQIAVRTGVPAPFLQQLIAPLKAAGLVATRRGPAGGLTLAVPADEITLLSVLDAVRTHADVPSEDWLSLLPAPHGQRLHDIERLLPRELELLTLADLAPHWSGEGADPQQEIPEHGLPPRRLLAQVGRQAAALVAADVCRVYFGSRVHGFITTAYDARMPDKHGITRIDAADASGWMAIAPVGVVATAWISGGMVVVTDVESDPRASREWAQRYGARSVLAAPITAGVDGWGVLIVAKAERHVWTDDEVDLVRDLGELCGLAIVGHNHLGAASDVTSEQEEDVI